MIAAPELPNETTRLQALRSLKLLDTSAEERFDRITRLARKLFGVRTALFSLVDEHRQWFKSAEGMDAAQTPRNVSFCGHAIASSEPLIVPDATQDQRFADNPLVTGAPHIRFYAGCAVESPDGQRVGSLCVLGDEPRQVTAQELAALQALARMIEADLVGTNTETSDTLTELSNRRGFLEIGRYVFAHCQRYKLELQLLRLQVDWLARRPSELAARKTLAQLAPRLLGCFRGADLLARLNESQFVLLLTCPAPAANIALTRMNRALEAFNVDRPADEQVALSALQVSMDTQRHQQIEDLLAEADGKPQPQRVIAGRAPGIVQVRVMP